MSDTDDDPFDVRGMCARNRMRSADNDDDDPAGLRAARRFTAAQSRSMPYGPTVGTASRVGASATAASMQPSGAAPSAATSSSQYVSNVGVIPPNVPWDQLFPQSVHGSTCDSETARALRDTRFARAVKPALAAPSASSRQPEPTPAPRTQRQTDYTRRRTFQTELPACLEHYMRFSNMQLRVDKVSFVSGIRWALAPPWADPQLHISRVVNMALSLRTHFKIGITYIPATRKYTHRMYHRPDRIMFIALVTENPDVMKQHEKQALDRYRRIDRSGNIVNADGHANCMNRARGGESGEHGSSPFFVYVIAGNGDGWDDHVRINMDFTESTYTPYL
jgi:hypothetical protein